jgi:polyhydroxyalkanoate synthase
MDLIPKPDQIVAASANVAHKLLYGGVADLRPMPRTLIDDGMLREVYHYRPAASTRATGDPVLLVTPLAAPSLCFDLRRGCSLVEHFVTQGRPTYLVEYGQVAFKDRNLGMEHWISEVIPEAIREVSRHAGGRPVHLVGWSLGGIFSLLTAAAWSSLPIASVTTVGSPIDIRQVPLIAPVRPLLGVVPDRASLISLAYRAMGGVPQPLVRRAFQLSAFDKLVTKPFVQLAKLDDTEFLAQIEAVDRFTANMLAYPGRTFGQLYHRMVKGNELARGTVSFEGRDISFADITVPVLSFGGAGDTIAPVSCVRPITKLVPNAAEMRFEVVPGGHLGMLTGRAARHTTWRILDEFIEAHSSDHAARTEAAARAERKAAKEQAAKEKARAQRTAKKTSKKTAKKPAAKGAKKTAKAAAGKPVKKAAAEPTIGANPERRFSSASSRSLSTARPAKRDAG